MLCLFGISPSSNHPPFYLGKDWFFSLDLLILLSVHLVRCRSAPLGGFRRVSCVPADTPLPSLPVFSCVDFPLLSIVAVLVFIP